MLYLAVDTAGPICAACIYDSAKDNVVSSVSEDIGRGHAEMLPAIVERTLSEARLTFSDINMLAVSEGPGSFAGIRVGISFIRALALALKIPSIGVSSLIAMAETVRISSEQDVAATIDARRGDVYLAILDKHGETVLEPSKLTIEQVNDLIANRNLAICGNGVHVLNAHDSDILHQDASPSIEAIARLAAKAKDHSTPPKPQYLRAADAKKQAGFVLERL